MTTLGLERKVFPTAFLINICSILAVMSKSAITPSLRGRTATIEPGVLPITSLASLPTYFTVSVRVSTATTEGSRMTMPLPFIKISVLAVPKSIPISFENINAAPFMICRLSVSSVLYRNLLRYCPAWFPRFVPP